MLPALAEVLALVRHLQAKVYAFRSRPTETTVGTALDQARGLLVLEANPRIAAAGAIFFAFACRGKALGEMWPLLPMVLAKLVAKGNGYGLNVTEAEFHELRMQIVMRNVRDHEVVRWFRDRSRSMN